jgi:Flp pilus assembly pilin Flp
VEALVARLCRCEEAASHIEYALIAGFAGTLLLGAYIRLADSLDGFYRTLAGLLDGVL